MKSFNSFLAEASFLKPDYVIGHKVAYNGKGFKELSALGYNPGDHFEIIAATKADYTYGDGPAEKYLKARHDLNAKYFSLAKKINYDALPEDQKNNSINRRPENIVLE